MATVWVQILVSAISGFIAGLLASIFATGVRKMLAPLILHRKIQMGAVSVFGNGVQGWCVDVSVRANRLWNLIASVIQDVEATVEFIELGGKSAPKSYWSTWVEPEIPASRVNLQIGHQYKLILTTLYGDTLRAVWTNEEKDSLVGNYDMVVTLKAGADVLGQWQFKSIILKGIMQKVSPVRIK